MTVVVVATTLVAPVAVAMAVFMTVVLEVVVVVVTTACAALSIAILAIEAITRRFAPALPPMLPISQIRVPLPPLSKHVLQIPVRGKIHPPIR